MKELGKGICRQSGCCLKQQRGKGTIKTQLVKWQILPYNKGLSS